LYIKKNFITVFSFKSILLLGIKASGHYLRQVALI
jgi:hypothetical protein